jgi:gamma-glutamyltranspeptidase/glutathione hydrolase
VDAAVAIQAVLGLVEPQSSGLGGGSFMVFYDAKTGKVTAYDGREKAPHGARPDMFMGADGKPLPFVKRAGLGPLDRRARGGGHAGPGPEGTRQVAWSTLFKDAERLASDGFVVSPRLAGMIVSRAPAGQHARRGEVFHQARRDPLPGR